MESTDKTFIIDKNYLKYYKFIKYSIFVIMTYFIIYISLKEEENITPYKTILTMTTLISILFYIMDVNFPISNL